MAQEIAKPAPAAPGEAIQASEGVRTLVSFLVFVHLFTLVIGIVSNEVPSQLEQALARLPGLRQYRQVLGMELPYSYYFTRGNDAGGEFDIDFTLTTTVKRPDGSTETLSFPNAEMWPHQRYHRYQMLARQVATFAGEDAPDPSKLELLVQAIASGILHLEDAKSVEIRCRGQLTPPGMEEFQPAQDLGPRFRDAYEGRAFLTDDRVELLKKDPARDTAPPPKNQ
jgi:hypothetical protein